MAHLEQSLPGTQHLTLNSIPELPRMWPRGWQEGGKGRRDPPAGGDQGPCHPRGRGRQEQTWGSGGSSRSLRGGGLGRGDTWEDVEGEGPLLLRFRVPAWRGPLPALRARSVAVWVLSLLPVRAAPVCLIQGTLSHLAASFVCLCDFFLFGLFFWWTLRKKINFHACVHRVRVEQKEQ